MNDEIWIGALGALGAWLLVAGPLHQASKELRGQGLAQRRDLPVGLVPSQPVSAWWWLLPPVAYWKHRRDRMRLREQILRALPRSEAEQMVAFTDTAIGWLLVAAGATLIGVKETWELVQTIKWPVATTWVIAALALLIAVGDASVTAARANSIISQANHP